MSDIPVWNCQFEGGDLSSLTVGAKFTMKCHGDIAVSWDQSASPVLVFPKEEDSYSLSILKTDQLAANDVVFEVTAYKPGEHKPEYIRVLQGKGTSTEKGFEFSKPIWAVKSVLDPQKQQPQPYGPVGPWRLSLPIWFWAALILALGLLAYAIVRKLRKVAQRRRMLEDLKLHRTALPPLFQFYRDARQIRRRLHTVKENEELKKISLDLDREFRLFVLRQFQVPALEWSNRSILEDLRRRHRKTYRLAGDSLRKTLRELEKLRTRIDVTLPDLEQMHRMSLDAAEKLMNEGGPR